MRNKCCYSWYDKELGMVYCSKVGQYCDYKKCPFKEEFRRINK